MTCLRPTDAIGLEPGLSYSLREDQDSAVPRPPPLAPTAREMPPPLSLPPPSIHLRPSLRSAPAQPRARLRSCPGSAPPPPPPRPAPATAAAAAAILAPRRLNYNFIENRSHGAGPQGRTSRVRGGAVKGKKGGADPEGGVIAETQGGAGPPGRG